MSVFTKRRATPSIGIFQCNSPLALIVSIALAGLFLLSSFAGLPPPRNPTSVAPFNNDWIVGQPRAKMFDVLVQCVSQFDEHRAEFLALFYSKKPPGEGANFIFHTAHSATLHQDDAVARQQTT